MIDVALGFIVKNVNAYLVARSGSPDTPPPVVLSPLVDDLGKWVVDDAHIGATLINVEEERVLRAQERQVAFVNGRNVILPAPLKLNLHLLFASRLKDYALALRQLSLILTYFQGHPSFSRPSYPDLDLGLDKLSVELMTLGYDQLNQIWTFVGSKQLPSVVYKIRMVTLQDDQVDVAVPVTSIATDVGRA
jgi:hypothetical protein